MSDADRERLIEILKLDSCPSPYLCDENCKYANLKQCYEERTADLLLEHGVIVPPCKVGDTVLDWDGETVFVRGEFKDLCPMCMEKLMKWFESEDD